MTILGKIFAAVILFIGIGIIAVPTGLIASAITQVNKGEDK